MENFFSHKDIIYTIYQEQSFSKAAQKLFISQPSLSVMIRKIEEDVGFPLFDRTSKPIRMTEAGMEYIRAAEAKSTQQPGKHQAQQGHIQDNTDKLAIFQIRGTPYFSYTSGFKMPI